MVSRVQINNPDPQTFSLLFVCIALMSDMVSLFFVPVQWLFFAASSMVWLQYVWHAGKCFRRPFYERCNVLTASIWLCPSADMGICTPTVLLWMLLVYLEAVIRWKDQKHMPWVDLCRPFAAHW